MQPEGGPRLLITDREGALWLERAHVDAENDRVVCYISDDEHRREYNVPHVNLAVLFLGQGTSISQSAIRLLGEEGVHLAVTGSGGAPLHMGGLTHYTATRHFREMLPIYLDPARSLKAAVVVMQHRSARMSKWGGKAAVKRLKQIDTTALTKLSAAFSKRVTEAADIAQLLGFEGIFSKACYAEFARMSALKKDQEFRRLPGEGGSRQDPVSHINRLIDHGNYLCYGMAGAALWALGIPPHMAVFHGKTRAGGLVFDLADSFKDALVLPLAFAEVRAKNHAESEQQFRARLISAFDDLQILKEAIATVEAMLSAGNEG